jgi:RNA-binding protein Musashi
MSVTTNTTTTTATSTTEKDEQLSSEVLLDKDGETYRKLFVGGLSWQTTEDNLQRYFQGLGLIVERVLIMREKASGRSRGFGFVILKHQDMVDKALSLPLQLDGRKIEAKRAISKRDIEKSHKIFVGGIPMSLTQSDFKKILRKFWCSD